MNPSPANTLTREFFKNAISAFNIQARKSFCSASLKYASTSSCNRGWFSLSDKT